MPDSIAPTWEASFLREHRLPASYLPSARQWFDPLAQTLAALRQNKSAPVLIAINGCQGSGKSTVCAYLQAILCSRYKLSVVTLSLDDFYLPQAQRQDLAQTIHPLLATRGVPGTHDMTLLDSTIDSLLHFRAGQVVPIPRFDKARDDRHPAPELMDKAVDVVLLEGWCLGATAQEEDELVEPVNALEDREDCDGVWRQCVNRALSHEFEPLYQRIHYWVMFQAPGFDCVYRWRLEQEQKLASVAQHKPAGGVMNERELARFIQFFQRITEICLRELPSTVNQLYVLNENRQIQSSSQPLDIG